MPYDIANQVVELNTEIKMDRNAQLQANKQSKEDPGTHKELVPRYMAGSGLAVRGVN